MRSGRARGAGLHHRKHYSYAPVSQRDRQTNVPQRTRRRATRTWLPDSCDRVGTGIEAHDETRDAAEPPSMMRSPYYSAVVGGCIWRLIKRKIKSDGICKMNSFRYFWEGCNTKPCCNFISLKSSTLKREKLWKVHRQRPLVQHGLQHEKSPTDKSSIFNGLVRMRGLEPPLLSKPEPKSGASASFATSAWDLPRL